MNVDHGYTVSVQWQGNRGAGTADYRSYGRRHLVSAEGKPPIQGSADRTFHGDADRWNPEELLVAALSECHMLSFLHVAVRHGVVVTEYTDAAEGTMVQEGDGGRFTSVTLHPVVTVTEPIDDERMAALHHEASEKCFIANSVSFPVRHEPRVVVASS